MDTLVFNVRCLFKIKIILHSNICFWKKYEIYLMFIIIWKLFYNFELSNFLFICYQYPWLKYLKFIKKKSVILYYSIYKNNFYILNII